MSKSLHILWGDFTASSFDKLDKNIQTKHLIVGGGIAGLSAAYFLLEHGEKDIVLIEKNTIGSGSTGHSAGMLVSGMETSSWDNLIRKRGAVAARAYWDAQLRAVDLVTSLVDEGHIQCDLFAEEHLRLAGNKFSRARLLKDFDAHALMHTRVQALAGEVLEEEFSSHTFNSAERTTKNISVNPLLLARGFAHYLKKRGVRIFEHTALESVEAGQAQTNHGTIAYSHIIHCTGVSAKSTRLHQYLTTICVTRVLTTKELEVMGLLDKDMFEDAEKRSYHYGKITGDNRLLVGYGDTKHVREFTYGYTHLPHVNSIERFIKHVFPAINPKIEYAWSAEYALSRSELPVIRVHHREVFINGAGTQIASIATVSYAISKLLGKKHVLDILFST